MNRNWTFGRTMATGFAVIMALNLAAGVIALIGLRSVVRSKDRVITVDTQLQLTAEHLLTTRANRATALRGYLLTNQTSYRDTALQAGRDFTEQIEQAKRLVHTNTARTLVNQIAEANTEANVSQTTLIALRQSDASQQQIVRTFSNASPTRIALVGTLTKFSAYERQLAADGVNASTRTASRDTAVIIAVLAGTVLLTTVLATWLVRNLRQRIGSAVGEVQSSSAELETTANQQAVGAMEQATAMSEISTTINELLASSRQITESAQRVAGVAEQTAGAGQSGTGKVASAQQSMAEIRHQVDVIVNHMLELGDKSQRIGAVLDIVSELAEQTNILAINSTIEAAGAGESGRRFAVVADEIRKLADRVGESTKEIRTLIDVVRSAVHTTVLATEIGSKAVDAGTAQFESVALSFEEIVGMVETTTEATREIELSTKQQTTAVEQVNFAVSNVTATTKETETNSTQTLQTASQLTELSTKLRKLVEPSTSG
jgi:methyl-accepting chemotaxis protein